MSKATDSEHSQDKQIMELAIWTRNWMRQMKAYVDEETGAHGYVTIDEWREISGKSAFEWTQTKREMIRLGIPILYDSYGGHYIGEPGQQAKNAVQLLKRAQTMIQTAHLYMTYMRSSGTWADCLPVLEDGLQERDLRLDGLGDLLNGFAGLEGGFDQLLIESD